MLGRRIMVMQLTVTVECVHSDLFVLLNVRFCRSNISRLYYNISPSLFTAPKLPNTIGKIDWEQMTSVQIKNLYRAIYSIKFPAAEWHGKPVKIREIELTHTSDNVSLNLSHLNRPGSIEYDKAQRCLHVYCSDGQFIRIKRLQVDGRKIIGAADFHAGYSKKLDPCDRYFT